MITYVTEKLAIGDSQDARAATQDKFDAALCVAIDLDICDNREDENVRSTRPRRHKVGLYDGPGNDTMTFAAAIILLESLVKQNKRVLVHCHAGMSRSVMVVAAWLTYKGIHPTLEAALAEVMPPRKLTIYRGDLYTLAQEALTYVKLT